MKDQELQLLVEKISLDYFQKPFKHYAQYNHRLRTTGGRYLLSNHNVEINPKHYDTFGLKELVAIIKHELCHYHLHIEGKGYRHSDRDFKELLNKVGGARYCQGLPGTRMNNPIKYKYKCSQCNTTYGRKRRVNTNKYVCGKCKGRLVLTP
jgi:SprT-like protein